MKNRLEKVYNKLPNQKIDLKAQKVELNLAFDLASLGSTTDVLIKNINESLFEIERYKIEIDQITNELKSDFSDLLSKAKELEDTLVKTEDLAKELGVEAGQINNFENSLDIYDEAVAIIEMVQQQILK